MNSTISLKFFIYHQHNLKEVQNCPRPRNVQTDPWSSGFCRSVAAPVPQISWSPKERTTDLMKCGLKHDRKKSTTTNKVWTCCEWKQEVPNLLSTCLSRLHCYYFYIFCDLLCHQNDNNIWLNTKIQVQNKGDILICSSSILLDINCYFWKKRSCKNSLRCFSQLRILKYLFIFAKKKE